MDIRALDRRAVEVTGGIIDRLTDEQLDLASPCSEWTVRGVIEHMVGNNHGMLAKLTGQAPPAEVSPAADPRANFRKTAEAFLAAFASDEAQEASFELLGVERTGAVAQSVHFADVLVHAWDIASAAGIDLRYDEDLAEAAVKVVSRFPEELWGPGGAFAARLPVAEDASAQDRLLALTGRAPVASAA
ncbi:TIGR03086 family metal-binding protein [Actinokineospora xionganensis]|uniref:TIGR03086 family protein n=1 Tax=Actinokineospora xionganensis TaxID=2684470 RepID=A0ABR7LC30_9PSEU|nr:TIGR03086 family metal-binding protein [Actinokineospora xionganensis]MBC6450256.1 TIGR03086 family protein [Actinokineospora xionganensis]